MRYFIKVGLLFLIITSCKGQTNLAKVESQKAGVGKEKAESGMQNAEIKTGADNYDTYLTLLKDKKVGIVTNQTGIITIKEFGSVPNNTNTGSDEAVRYANKSIVDFLLDKKINLIKIFAPEHGFRGTADAGEHVVDGKDAKTGLPIISLYGDNKKPKAEQLAGLDVLVFDLQDVGARFYTYISSLHYIMEACAENNIQLIILDRPNPNGGIVDGPVLEKENTSFIGMHRIPAVSHFSPLII